MKFGGGRDSGLVRGDRGVTGTYFLWWWDLGQCGKQCTYDNGNLAFRRRLLRGPENVFDVHDRTYSELP